MSHAALPRELCDLVVDYLHAERVTLGSCALVCRAWVPASRFHLFERISLSQKDGHAAARLNDLLASPRATFAGAVRRLDLYNALALVQIRQHGRVYLKTLLEIVPRISQLHHIQFLALSDLPFDVFPAFPKVHTLYLVGITAGPALLRLADHLPSLTRLTLKRVHAIPYRVHASPKSSPTPQIEQLRSLTVRGSSLAFLGWMAILGPCTSALDLGDFCPSELPYLTEYLQTLGRSLESLRLGLTPGTDVREFAWEELAQVLGQGTRLVVCIEETSKSDEDEPEEDDEDAEERDGAFLRAQFPELEQRGMLDLRRLPG
ncbi:hypothetical protein C8R44DRAFT_779047 [Mycena epipterygia]|nr:hypothetical protein C8R44DRAFT_779047 [Mycena epipterygia]